MIEFELIDNSQELEANLIDNSQNIEVQLIKEIDKYDDLKGKPSVNNVILTGNKTLSELGIQPEGDYSTNSYVNTELNKKVDKVSGKGLSTNDYTTEEKNKLADLYNYDDSEIVSDIDNLQNKKVDKVTGKGLSTNDFTDTYKSNVDSNTSARHIHSNKTILDDISSTDISNWNNKAEISDIPDVSDFITKDVNNLTYYTTTANLSRVALTGNYDDLNDKPNLSIYATNQSLNNETTVRENTDIGLQGQIDAITSSSDVKDIVGTYTELQNYDTSTLGNDDIIKVLQDSTHNDAMTYYRWVITGGTGSWQYIGQEGPYYTKSETETMLTDYAKKTDYATNQTGGVIKIDTSYNGINIGSSGFLFPSSINYETYTSKENNYFIGKGTLENVITGKGLITSSSDITGNASTSTTLKAFNYSRKGTNNTWAKVATASLVGTWEEKHAYLFVKGTHNSNFKQNGIISIDVVGNATKSKVNSYSAQFISASTDLNVENFYIEYQDGDANTNATINFWVKNTTNTYASWQFKILQNTGWTIESADTSVTTLPTQYFTGKNAELNNISLKAINDKDGNDITTTYAKNTDYATSVTGGVVKTGYSINVDTNGNLYVASKSYSDYDSMGSNNAISKGTLENVITGKGLIDSSYHDNTKQNVTDNTLQTINKTIPTAINEVNSIAKGANQALSYASYSAMVTAFNSLDGDEYNVGQNVYIVTTEVPDLWVSGVESTSSTYTYVDDATIVSALQTNGYIQVGYYKLSMLETQKVDLTNYVTNTDYATSSKAGVLKIDNGLGTSVSQYGVLVGAVKTYAQYNSAYNDIFISKGTLENAITGKGLGTYSKPSGGIPSTDLDSSVQTSLGKADGSVQLSGGSSGQTVSLTSGTGTTPLGIKSMSTSCYMSFNAQSGWLASYGVGSNRKPTFYNGTSYELAYATDIPKLVTLTQADYDDLVSGGTVDANTYYFIEET